MDILDYKIGDRIASKDSPDSFIGTCTGFTHDDTCILIDGKCWGGKTYFTKCMTIDLLESEYEIISD